MKNLGYFVGLAALSSCLVGNVDALGGPCPGNCNGNGLCEKSTCKCFEGYQGADCSERTCPSDLAWSDHAVEVDKAHQLAECSNGGVCDRKTGTCTCHYLFTGVACQKTLCPNNCNGRGICQSMRYYAELKDPGKGTVFKYDDVWDAHKIHGCKCDPGFTGFDCSLRDCPRGDDPLTTGQVDEVQLLKCSAENGFFTLTFGGYTSEPIPYNTALIDFEKILEAVPGVGDLTVTFSETGIPVCTKDYDQVVAITFLQNFGDLDNLLVKSTHIANCADATAPNFNLCGGSGITLSYDGDALAPTTGSTIFSVKGTKENEYCSNRGSCDKTTGICTCYTNFVTSNGRGGEGTRGDCGYAAREIQACPGLISCSGHGTCSHAPSYQCQCSLGWESGDCSVRKCPLGKAWFDQPIAENRAHQHVVCSSAGTCDGTTGQCRCYIGYEGSACSQMACAGNPTKCSGHGTCNTMSQLANERKVNGEWALTTYGNIPNDPFRWDYDMIYGCICDEGYFGYDCSKRACPTGDDPEVGWEPGQEQKHEVQLLRCRAEGGTAKLYFRTKTTESIPWNADVTALKAALVALTSITDLEVTYSSGITFCTTANTNVVTVKFTQELGDVPTMKVFYQDAKENALLTHTSDEPLLEVAADGAGFSTFTSIKGTLQNLECSGRGTCNTDLGVCTCDNGFASSDGNAQQGQRGDCGWKVPWGTGSVE